MILYETAENIEICFGKMCIKEEGRGIGAVLPEGVPQKSSRSIRMWANELNNILSNDERMEIVDCRVSTQQRQRRRRRRNVVFNVLLTEIDVNWNSHRDIDVRFKVQFVNVLRATGMQQGQLVDQLDNVLADLCIGLTVPADLHALRNAVVDVFVEHFAQRALDLLGQVIGGQVDRNGRTTLGQQLVAKETVDMRRNGLVDQKAIIQIGKFAAQLKSGKLIVQLIDRNDGDVAVNLLRLEQRFVVLDGGLIVELAASLQILDENADVRLGVLERVRQRAK